MQAFLKKVSIASIWKNGEPDGWICGKWYIGYIQHKSGGQDSASSSELFILCSNNFFKINIDLQVIDDNGIEPQEKHYYIREGTFYSPSYTEMQLNLTSKPVYTIQKKAINSILKFFKQKKNATALLYGKSGAGKSMTAQYLCAELLKTCSGISFVDSFDPFMPGDNFANMYLQISPTEEKPLVVMLEEIDINILKLHKGEISHGANSPVQINNKPSWNLFLDKFDRELFPHVILILTSNKSAAFFDELDPSYMRHGRVDVKFEF